MGIESICENFYLSTMDESFYRNHWISINVISNEIGNEIGNETKKRNFSLLEKNATRQEFEYDKSDMDEIRGRISSYGWR